MAHTRDAHALGGIVDDIDHAPITDAKARLEFLHFEF